MGTFVRALVVMGLLAAGWGVAGAGTLSATPSPLSFGNVSVSGGPAQMPVTLSNAGTTTTVNALSLGAGCGEFSVSTVPLPAVITGGSSIQITVIYDPVDRTADTCTITPTSNGSGGAFTVTGDGIAPVLSVNPVVLSFADQRWNGGAGQNLNLTLTNAGEEAITSTNITAMFMNVSSSFSLGAISGLPIAGGGGTGTLPVNFNPTSVGPKSNIVIISLNNDPPAASDASITVSGNGTQSIQTFAPTSLNVGSFEVGSNGTNTIAVGNDAAATDTLSITSVRIIGSNAADFAFTDHGCTNQGPCVPTVMTPPIEAGTAETFAIRCAPSATGTRAATLEITSDDPNGTTTNPGNPRTATLTCTGRSPEVTVTPLSLAFGTVRVGTPSSLLFTISNASGATSADLTYSVTEAITDVGLTCAPSCMGSLAPGNAATVTVTFQPTATGLRSGNVVVTTNDLDEGTVNVAISGTGAASNLSAFTSPAFGSVPVAQTGGSVQNATVTNNGGVSLNTQMMTITGDASFSFAFPSGGCTSGTTCNDPARIVTAAANGGTAVIPVRCDPSSAGLKTATLNIISDDPSPVGGTDIALTCTGTVSAMTVTPATLALGNQRVNTTSATMNITVSNVGGAAPLNYSVTEPAGDQFIVTAGSVCNPTCSGLSVPAGQMATVTVAIRPTTTGLKNGTVLINDTDNFVTDVNVSVSGTGVEPVATLTTAATLAFGNVNVNTTSGPQTITVMNTGTMDLTISGVSETDAGNDFDLTGPTGATTVAAGASQSWMVTCDPETRGARTGTITINNNSANAPSLAVPLTCTALEGLLVVTASPVAVTGGSMNFGSVILGMSRSTTVTVANQGNVAVTISSVGIAPTTEGFTRTAPAPDMVVPAGGTRTFSVAFTPTNPAQGAATLTITSDWNDPSIGLVGDALTSAFVCSPSIAMLGDVQWDATQQQMITLDNTGDTAVNVTGVAWASGDTGEFAPIAAGTGQGLLPGGQVRTFTITAVPTDAMLGVRNAVLRITTDLPSAPVCDIPVSYTSVGPAVTLSPGMVVDFGGVEVDGGPVTLELTLTNTGTGRMDVTSVTALSGTFSRTNFADLSLDPAQSGTLSISYDPTVEGDPATPETQTFTITTDGLYLGTTQQPPSIQVTVRGYGTEQHLQVASALPFPDTYRNPTDAQSPPIALPLCNTGGATLDVTMITGEGAAFELVDAGPLQVPGGTAGAPACVDVPVRFRPTAYGTFAGTVTIMNNDNAVPMATVTLDGDGVAREVEVPVTVDLGRVPVGETDLAELALRFNNTSGAATFVVREVRRVDAGAPVEVRLGAGGFALAPGEHALGGTLHAAAAGTFAVEMDVFLDDDTVAHARLTLTGEALEKENYYSCSSGRPVELGGGLLAALAAIAMRRRRYRRPCRPSDGTTMNGS